MNRANRQTRNEYCHLLIVPVSPTTKPQVWRFLVLLLIREAAFPGIAFEILKFEGCMVRLSILCVLERWLALSSPCGQH